MINAREEMDRLWEQWMNLDVPSHPDTRFEIDPVTERDLFYDSRELIYVSINTYEWRGIPIHVIPLDKIEEPPRHIALRYVKPNGRILYLDSSVNLERMM